ncbi:lipid transfer protein 4 [Prunus dulcis]|nr:lipid transfer protein 4 [Prunus dulcis]
MIHQAILLLFLLASASASASAMGPKPSCPDITYQLGPCVSYLLQIEVAPPPACCDGVKYLSQYSSDKEDREAICSCIKGAASMMGLTDFPLISALPNTCGVSVKLPPISSDIDCSQ